MGADKSDGKEIGLAEEQVDSQKELESKSEQDNQQCVSDPTIEDKDFASSSKESPKIN